MQQRERGEHNLLLIGYYRLDKISSSVMVRDGAWKLDLCGGKQGASILWDKLDWSIKSFFKRPK